MKSGPGPRIMTGGREDGSGGKFRVAIRLASLALRNLRRRKRRTAITASALAAGLCMFVLFDSLIAGLENDGARSMVWYDIGGMQVQNERYAADKDSLPLDIDIDDPAGVVAAAAKAGFAATPRAVFSGELVVGGEPWPEDGSAVARITAIDPGRDGAVFRLGETVREGRWLRESDQGIVLGSKLAETLGAQVGWSLTVVTRTKDGAWQTIDAEIIGIVATPNAAVNRVNAYLTLSAADECLGLGGSVNQVAVAFPEEADAARAAGKLGAALENAGFAGLAVLPWRVVGADFVGFVESRRGISRVLLLLVFIIAAVGVSNAMLLSVLERTREIGALRAQGMRDREVVAMLLVEAGAIGVIGAAAGILLASAVNAPFVAFGIDMTPLLDIVDVDLPFSGILRGAWHPVVMLQAVAVGALLSVAVSVVPARRAVRMTVVECMRHA
ncbi:MAG: FtsX-like permease family protein [Spirochaetes bacterium]|nr:FtsX-like permease family protein [Spirochaetota bacterium]